ncbi:hypothetical protein GCM10007049_16830 [Echinicola pacifica]|uniref:Endonuclease/exonuclease/phosphatase domain-containing protein n=1 Tax=Echinicola pacifica TaxID=346377 RepID=A0A918UNU4_9BACT|nr:endonuclease/exonuclease/phosphatase family protein [Echinicola pacifica]GGZ25002.1 hypothetical protein GCM10007049_16830 [Echinicola pacifica]
MKAISLKNQLSSSLLLGLCMLINLLLSTQVFSQENGIRIDFEKDSPYYPQKKSKPSPGDVYEAYTPRYAAGIEGRALDLSQDAALRMPIKLHDSLPLPYGEKQDFTVSFWVKTKEYAKQGTVLAGNKKQVGKEEIGWMVMATEAGAWALYISDGKQEYAYEPSLPRQQINDGDWHQIGFSISREEQDLYLFFDGKQMGIYNIGDLGALRSEWATTFGGTASNWDYLGQWEAFNGYLDNISILPGAASEKVLSAEYQTYFPSIHQKEVWTGSLRLLSWNIWHGGHRFGKQVGLERVIETIQVHQPDIVTLIETYGSVEEIADALGYHFYLISSNLSILSKYPVKKTIKAFRPFNFGGAIISLPNGKDIAIMDTWLHYLPDYQKSIVQEKMAVDDLIKEEGETRHQEVKDILSQIQPFLANSQEVPIIMSGDFNVESHLDWTEATKDIHHGYVVPWPVTMEMENAGFTDSFREAYPNPLESPGFTYWPQYRGDGSDYIRPRIDYIFYKGASLGMVDSQVISQHPVMFPSDHAAVITEFTYD